MKNPRVMSGFTDNINNAGGCAAQEDQWTGGNGLRQSLRLFYQRILRIRRCIARRAHYSDFYLHRLSVNGKVPAEHGLGCYSSQLFVGNTCDTMPVSKLC